MRLFCYEKKRFSRLLQCLITFFYRKYFFNNILKVFHLSYVAYTVVYIKIKNNSFVFFNDKINQLFV